jgi:hypothetical protein
MYGMYECMNVNNLLLKPGKCIPVQLISCSYYI